MAKKRRNGKAFIIIGIILLIFIGLFSYIAFSLKSGTLYDLIIETTSGFIQLFVILVALVAFTSLGVGLAKAFNKIK